MRYVFNEYVLDTGRRELWRGTTAVAVEPLVFDLLACLIENRDRVLSKDDLLAAVWQGRIVSESTLGSTLNAVRTAIGDNGEDQRLIRTLPRKGFRFVGPAREEQASAAAVAATSGPIDSGAPVAGRRRAVTPAIVLGSVGGVAAVVAALAYLLWPAPDAARPSGQKFDAASVPLVDDEARKLLAGYPDRPDAKALAIARVGFAVADGHSNPEAAKQDALRSCVVRTMQQCRLYAVGMDVVWSKAALPLPAPGDLRFEPLDVPLVPDEIPTLPRERRDDIARTHMKAPDHRALAFTARGDWTVSGRGTRAEAARLAVERCSERWQRPCLLLAIDGLLTIRIPQSRPAIGIFLPSTEADLAATDKERIARVYNGAEWRALAKGKNGSWHAVAGAASEADAIEAALKSCSLADAECRLFAIGNFRVAE